ncbi:MAG: energy transducer TonB, partial [Treponema sp.]|nr:energy transducer TonB [Treponema sp.]
MINKIRPVIFAAAAVLHITVVMFAGFRINAPVGAAAPAAGVMRLIDVREISPPAPPDLPAPPPENIPETPRPAHEALAGILAETGEAPPQAPQAEAPPQGGAAFGQTEYLRRHQLSSLPVLPEAEIAAAIVYPPLARRLNIEGVVTVELFIDRHGVITDMRVIREDPANRGFAAAA